MRSLLIDTHCHLSSFAESEIPGLLHDAAQKGVVQVCAVTESLDDLRMYDRLLSTSTLDEPMVSVFAGLHPVQILRGTEAGLLTQPTARTRYAFIFFHVNPDCPLTKSSNAVVRPSSVRSVTVADWEDFEIELRNFQSQGKLKGIGEIGLDFSRHVVDPTLQFLSLSTEACRAMQRQVFRAQLLMAMEWNLPVTVHSRAAGRYAIEDILDVVNSAAEKNLRVALHAFDGNIKYVRQVIQACGMGCKLWFSVPPAVELENSHFKKLVQNVPLQYLLLETDAPALGPVKNERNVPANLSRALDQIALIKQMPSIEVASQIYQNAMEWLGEPAR
jgi:TatD DNase family protein